MFLLINPNQYKYPPVPPIGLEYLLGELRKAGFKAEFLDLCFSENPINELSAVIEILKPEIAGITIRQIDTVLQNNNEFFLDNVKQLVDVCKKHGVKVVLGGAGFSIMPVEIVSYTGADYGIYGPGGRAICDFMNMIETGKKPERIINGFRYYEKGNTCNTNRIIASDYNRYIVNGGIAGFNTQTGCNGACVFCTERNKPVFFNDPKYVANEINELKNTGVSNFHLCDSEFNQNIDHCINVCKAIYEKCGTIDWTLYMKSRPFSSELFKWLKKSGASLITLSLDAINDNPATYNELSDVLRMIADNGIKTAIDLSVGLPGENEDELKKLSEFLNEQPCSTVGVNATYRIYPSTPLHSYILNNYENIKENLYDFVPGPDLIKPSFYNSLKIDMLKNIFPSGGKFRMEGFEKAVNYQRI